MIEKCIENVLSDHHADRPSEQESLMTRKEDRGHVLRVTLDDESTVVLKVWVARNRRERLKQMVRMSNACHEWANLTAFHRLGIRVPRPLHFVRLDVDGRHMREIVVIEDLGHVVTAVEHLGHLATGSATAANEFEDRVLDMTLRLVRGGYVDIDHHLRNMLVVDGHGEPIRIDLECARRRWPWARRRQAYAEMIARMVISHVFAMQPEVQASERFAARLAEILHVPRTVLALASTSVAAGLERQRRRKGIHTAVTLPW